MKGEKEARILAESYQEELRKAKRRRPKNKKKALKKKKGR
jgi:hypothetical protein